MKIPYHFRMSILIFFFFFVGCVSVPKHSPFLNQRISEGIDRLRQQHLETLDKLYQRSIDSVDNDHEKIWGKAKNLFATTEGRAPSSEEDFHAVSIITAGIREEILKAIRTNMDEVRGKIESNYSLLRNMNDEVTQYLYSAVKVKESERGILDFIQKNTKIDLDVEHHLENIEGIKKKILLGGQDE